MRRWIGGILATALVVTFTPQLRAQQWVAKMVEEKEHDFGTVARGSDTVYRFAVKNIYKQEMRLASIRSSCGCTSPTLDKDLLQSGETGYVVAVFNTRTFKGVHSATLTLRVEWKDDRGVVRAGETQMRVHGRIREDIVFQPGSVKFPTLPSGQGATASVSVNYAGRSSWRLTDVRSASEHLEVEMVEKLRDQTRVMYDLKVRLKDSAPAGILREQLVLVTNDQSNPRVTLDVEGLIRASLSVAPESISLGKVPKGSTVSKRIVVRGEEPFQVTDIDCGDDCFTFSRPGPASKRHIITVHFTPTGGPTGEIKREIRFQTDLGGEVAAVCTAYATVTPDGDAATSTASKQVELTSTVSQ